MRNQFRNQWSYGEPREFFEKAFRRDSLPVWDARWQGLSVPARRFFLDVVKLPGRDRSTYSDPASVPRDKFPPDVLDELSGSGFVEIRRARFSTDVDRVLAGAGVDDFAWRARILRRHHLLDADRPSEFSRYVDEVFSGHELAMALSRALHEVGFDGYLRLDEALRRFVIQHRWQEWVAQLLHDPLAKSILRVVTESGGVLPLSALSGRIERSKPEAVRRVMDELVAYLALVEDLQPETWELMVGFLPAVREKITKACQPRERPPLLVCDRPKEVAPHGSALVSDLRAVLLEIASGPPRLRSDHGLHQRQIERFLAVLEPLPAWLLDALDWSAEMRLQQALAWASTLQLVKQVPEGRQKQLHLSAQGHQWLASGLEEQYAGIFNHLTHVSARDERSRPRREFYDPDWAFTPQLLDVCTRFFGERVAVQKVERKGNVSRYGEFKPEDQQALREHVERAFAGLKPGAFYQVESVKSHFAFKEHNPLNTGLAPDRVAVFRSDQRVPPLEEELEDAGTRLLDRFVYRRLIPLGCVRAAIDDEDNVCIAREPRLDVYFGRKVAPADLAPPFDAAGRVVVQPDFSVIVIGLNPASLAELTPFCERVTKSGGQGATVLKLTREAVLKAVSLGMKPADIMGRLARHASNDVPANVEREIKEWANWVRQVTSRRLTVLRCGDLNTADRVMNVLRRHAERISDTIVAIDHLKLTASEREKLRGQGILVQTDSSDIESDRTFDSEF
jgi:Helicase conserved C-terminal domain